MSQRQATRDLAFLTANFGSARTAALLENFRIALTPQRLAAVLVTVISTLVGAFAAQGMSMVQWIGGIVAVMASIAVAVIVHRWPAKARVKVR